MTQYKHGEYYLYALEVKGSSGRNMYFFSKKDPSNQKGTPCDIPEGKEVGINSRTSLPYLRNK